MRITVSIASFTALLCLFQTTTSSHEPSKPLSSRRSLVFQQKKKQLLDALQGKWELQSYTNVGVKKSASDPNTTFHGLRIQLSGDRRVVWYTKSPAPPPSEAADSKSYFAVKAAKPFGHFDYWWVGLDGKPSGWKKVGIYRIDGDQLTICFRVQEIPGPPLKRPTRFDASKGTYAGLAVYKRLGTDK